MLILHLLTFCQFQVERTIVAGGQQALLRPWMIQLLDEAQKCLAAFGTHLQPDALIDLTRYKAYKLGVFIAHAYEGFLFLSIQLFAAYT